MSMLCSEILLVLNLTLSTSQTGMYCTSCLFSQRLPQQADVSYDITAGCVNGHNFLHVWDIPPLSNLSSSKIDTHDEKGLLLFG